MSIIVMLDNDIFVKTQQKQVMSIIMKHISNLFKIKQFKNNNHFTLHS